MTKNKSLSLFIAMILLLSSLTLVASIIPNSQSSVGTAYQINSNQLNQVSHPAYLSHYLTAYQPPTEQIITYANTIGGGSFIVKNISCTYEACYSNYNSYNKNIYTGIAGIGELVMINGSNAISNKITGVNPKFFSFDQQNGNIYVTDCINNEVYIYNSTLSLLHRIGVSSAPTGVVFDPANGYAFVSHCKNSQVNVIAMNGTIINNLSLPNGFADRFTQSIYDPLNKEVYIAANNSVGTGELFGINYTGTINISIPLNINPSGLALNTFNGYLYVGSAFSSEALVITQNGSTVDNIALPSCANSAIFDPYNNYTYFTTVSGNVAIINSTDQLVADPYLGNFPEGVGYSPTTTNLYISNGKSGNYHVSVISSNAYYSAYEMNFTNLNLPSGTAWYLSLSDGQSFSSNSKNIIFYEPNGTYNYKISNSNRNYAPSNITGNFTVYGHPLNIDVTFNLVTYAIDVNEKGLPAGTGWYLGIDSVNAAYSTASSIKLSEPNGSYKINATSTDIYATYFPVYSVEIDGKDTSLTINFTLKPQVGNIKLTAATPNSFAYDPENHYTYIAENAYSSILVMKNDTLVTNISVNASKTRFCGMAYDPVRNLIFVSNCPANDIVEINATDNSVQKYFVNITLPLGLTFDPANQNIYVATLNGIVVCISGKTLTEHNIRTYESTNAIIYDPQNNNIYASNFCEGNLSVISNNSQLVGSIAVGSFPTSMVFDPHNGYLYVENSKSSNLSILNANDKVVSSLNVTDVTCGPISQMVYDPFNYNIYLIHNSGNVSVIFNNTCIGEFRAGNLPVYTLYNPSSNEVCVLNEDSNNITQITSRAYTTLYNVVVTENNLPMGTEWYLNLSNGCDLSSSTPHIAFQVPYGMYNFTIESNISHTYNGNLIVSGNTNLSLTLPLYTYPVTVEETGLPEGTTWFVNLSNGTHLSSTNSTITFPGTDQTEYNYTVSSSDFLFRASPESGSFKVNSSELLIKINFVQYIFAVTIKETGLADGASWYLNVSGQPTIHTTASSITMYLQNGNYTLTASSSSFKNVTLNLTVNNANLTQEIAFEPIAKSLPAPSYLYTYIIIAVAAVAVVGALLLLMRKRVSK
ncbi:MAG: YncE family protein [Thermoplasmata archaeon]